MNASVDVRDLLSPSGLPSSLSLPHPSFPSDRHLISRVSVNNTKELELQGSSLKPLRCLTSQLVFLQAAARAACGRAPWYGMGLLGGSSARLQMTEATLHHPLVSTRGGHQEYQEAWARVSTTGEGGLDAGFAERPSLH